MRRVPILSLALLLVVAAMPSAASAQPSIRYTDTHTFVSCDSFGDESGTVSFYAEVSSTYGSYAGLAFWQPPASPLEGPPTWISDEFSVDLSADGSLLTAVLQLYEFIEDPEGGLGAFVGEATVTAALEPMGDPMPFEYSSRGSGSNQQYRVEGLTQLLSVSGEALLPGALAFALDNCDAANETLSVFATQPDAYVQHSSFVSLGCYWEDDGLFAYLSAYSEQGYASADMFVGTDAGAFYGFTDVLTLTDRSFAASFDLFSAGEPEPAPEGISTEAVGPGDGDPVGSVDAAATLTRTGERFRFIDRFGFAKYTYSGEVLAVSGAAEVSIPGADLSLAMDEFTCYAEKVRFGYREATPNENAKGPGGGKPLANDLPENATPISVGTSVTVRSTAGTAAEPEVPCTAIDPEYGEFELPLGHTAWWTFDGTGAEVTVDTAGSDFDTMVGVYVLDGEGFTSLGCVDDVFFEPDGGSLQAAISVATEPGVTYYVQVGGFAGSTGRLELTLY
ncbi:MAG TPA: hypothetical protein VK838_03440 [Candidatus Limnocylindrales bacterium]|nr:hypothetical protein [Candidatus Limnocylindrales bacterium]